jgi:endonuclease/exonuclease/phosphatase family metal-dependent hydrolase
MIAFRPIRIRHLLGAAVLVSGATLAEPLPVPQTQPTATRGVGQWISAGERGDISVLTYNVAGLPWPLAKKDPEALRAIGLRLARMRAAGQAPSVVVLQEAFTGEAKAIGTRAGYPFIVEGPYLRSGTLPDEVPERNWMLGETAGTAVDSGLVILSDLPVLEVKRAAFPEGACAGFDCLAAKGVVLVTLELPENRKVMVADTHFNSRGACKAPVERSLAAYRRQAEFLARFIAENRAEDVPVIIAGDFNRGQRPSRIAALQSALGGLARRPMVDTLRAYMAEYPQALSGAADAITIVERARDLQFALDGEAARLSPVGADIPFGTEADGSMLSDHIGYTVRYRYSADSEDPGSATQTLPRVQPLAVASLP